MKYDSKCSVWIAATRRPHKLDEQLSLPFVRVHHGEMNMAKWTYINESTRHLVYSQSITRSLFYITSIDFSVKFRLIYGGVSYFDSPIIIEFHFDISIRILSFHSRFDWVE
jgi:hypothetical protein